MTLKAFSPSAVATQKLASTTTSGTVSAQLEMTSAAVRVINLGPNNSRIKFSSGAAALACTANDMTVMANTTEIFTVGSATFVTAQTDTGTAALEFTNGEGI